MRAGTARHRQGRDVGEASPAFENRADYEGAEQQRYTSAAQAS